MARLAGEDRVIDLFKKLGFGSLDARVYMTLLLRGPLTISQLMGELEAYRPQLHDSLSRLIAKGFVEVNRGKPTLYRAVSPQVVLDTFKAEMSKLSEEAMHYMSSLGSGHGRATRGIWILRSRMGLYRRYLETIESAQTDLLVCGSARFVKRLVKPLLDAQERDVLVYVLVYAPSGELSRPDIAEPLGKLSRVRLVVSSDHFIVCDSKMAVISYSKWRVMRGERGLVVEEPLFIGYLERDFLRNWMLARVLKDAWIKLPARFTFYGLALLEAKRLLMNGVRLSGEFRGWWVSSGERDTVRGEIVDVVVDYSMGVVMHFVVKTEEGIIRVGGPDAVVEEFAVQNIILERLDTVSDTLDKREATKRLAAAAAVGGSV